MVESIPPESTWSVVAVGRHQFPLATMAMAMGGHVRVGMEDNV
ncbi:MAG: 3-keto-5-aminohexanoate cleavage protein [Candidatus Marsarchaeota archaeon]|nr:3-keto-5-aminohexanoate cleavage protein [Candidatus Marsarchaeota archaeon]